MASERSTLPARTSRMSSATCSFTSAISRPGFFERAALEALLRRASLRAGSWAGHQSLPRAVTPWHSPPLGFTPMHPAISDHPPPRRRRPCLLLPYLHGALRLLSASHGGRRGVWASSLVSSGAAGCWRAASRLSSITRKKALFLFLMIAPFVRVSVAKQTFDAEDKKRGRHTSPSKHQAAAAEETKK